MLIKQLTLEEQNRLKQLAIELNNLISAFMENNQCKLSDGTLLLVNIILSSIQCSMNISHAESMTQLRLFLDSLVCLPPKQDESQTVSE